MKELLLFPYNGNAIEALDCISNEYNVLGFVDDQSSKHGISPYGIPVFDRSAFMRYPNACILAVPGSPTSFTIRDKIISELNIETDRFVRIIHPKAVVSKFAKIGTNVLIMAGVVLTSNVFIGDHVCILPNTVIHHDSVVSNYTLIGSNVTIAGYSQIGNNCYIGSGASVINGITIGDKCLIGLGTNVIKSLPSNSKVVGNPARNL